MHNIALIILIGIPLVGSLIIFSLPEGNGLVAKQIAFILSAVTFIYALVLTFTFNTKGARFQFEGSWVWIKSFGVHVAFGVDGIAVVLIAMSTLLVPVVVLASWNSFDTIEDAEELPRGSASGPHKWQSAIKAARAVFPFLRPIERIAVRTGRLPRLSSA